MNQSLSEDLEYNCTHAKKTESFSEALGLLKKKIVLRGDLPHVTCARQLEVLEELCEFPLGRFILERRGANGFWTDYMIAHPAHGKVSGLNIEGKPFGWLENWFLNECPIVVAHQERFQIFQKLAQGLLRDHMVLASIPCGLMRDLITLDFSEKRGTHLIGVDIDPESLALAEQFAREKNIPNTHFIRANAWDLSFSNEIDLITSSGLNVYESDPEKVLKLYSRFFDALRPGGFLITSVLTFPPGGDRKTDWKTENISPETLCLDKVLHQDILDIKWRNFRSIPELKRELKWVGFSNVSVHFDAHRIFPTILAQKPGICSG
jgi:SAM-dependent methyltransferase